MPALRKSTPKNVPAAPSSPSPFDYGQFIRETLTPRGLLRLISDPSRTWFVAGGLVMLEVLINIVIINKVSYTEIDWSTYLEQVNCFLNGTRDYEKIEGPTGPLVYPAGHLYLFTALSYVTSFFSDQIRAAQYLFGLFYVLNLAAVFRIYTRASLVPPYVLILMCITSYRIHSIFVLRLFNDPLAMLLFYVAVNMFLDAKWALGSFIYSLAVAVKMNILLFAPGLLLIYLETSGLARTIYYLSICAVTQVLLALPFLWQHPAGYLARAFNLGRVFLFKWTVNWRWLPEHLFLNRWFHLFLLFCHLTAVVGFFWPRWYRVLKCLWRHRRIETEPVTGQEKVKYICWTLFVANLLGITFARSLHYQFYVWYYHSLPFLLWSTHLPLIAKLLLMAVIEWCWNTYPSTNLSSLLLSVAHAMLILGLMASSQFPASSKRKAI